MKECEFEAGRPFLLPGHSPYGLNWLVTISSRTARSTLCTVEGCSEKDVVNKAATVADAMNLYVLQDELIAAGEKILLDKREQHS